MVDFNEQSFLARDPDSFNERYTLVGQETEGRRGKLWKGEERWIRVKGKLSVQLQVAEGFLFFRKVATGKGSEEHPAPQTVILKTLTKFKHTGKTKESNLREPGMLYNRARASFENLSDGRPPFKLIVNTNGLID